MAEICPKQECEKAWGKDICLAKKELISKNTESKIKVGIMWGVMVFCAITAAGSVGALVRVVSAQSATEAKHEAGINRNTEKIEHVEKAHEKLEGSVKSIETTVNQMQIEQAVQGQILEGLAEKFRVPIPERPNGD